MESIVEFYQAYYNWSGVPLHRAWVWGASVVLLILYVVVDNWGQPWMEDDFWEGMD